VGAAHPKVFLGSFVILEKADSIRD